MSDNSEETFLRQLVAISSVFPNEKEILEFLEKKLIKLGFEIKRDYIGKNRWNILSERGKGKSSMLFYGHVDTVPDYGNWKTNPYRLSSLGDKLFGLGSCDMKGGIASFVCAVDEIRDRKIKVLFGVDEENISEGAWKVIEEKKEWFSDVEFMLVGEPGASARQTGGVNVVTLGRRGRVVFQIEVFGKSAHGAHPEKGINAITEASKIALEIEKMKLPTNKYLGPATLFIRKISGESTSLSIPDKALIEVDRHLVVPETIESAKTQIENIIRRMYKTGELSNEADSKVKVSVKTRATPYSMPYITDIKNPLVSRIIAMIKDNFSEDVIVNYGKSVADDNIFANKLKKPVVTIGPKGGNIHSSNEWISKNSLEEATRLYKQILEN